MWWSWILKGIYFLLAFLFAFIDYSRIDNKKAHNISQFTYYLPYYLLVYPAVIFCYGLISKNTYSFYDRIVPLLCRIIFSVAIYNLLLMIFIGYFRRFLRPVTCAYLWTIPNFLYVILHFQNQGSMVPTTKRFIYIPKNVMIILLTIWCTGFFFFFLKTILSDRKFQKELSEHASPVTDTMILEQFNSMKKQFDPADRIRLFYSTATKTPLSVGRSVEQMKVYLPENEYSDNELYWIFSHELNHLKKNDCGLKFYIGFVNALFWFVPMSWIASNRLAEDQELSCDEKVLEGFGLEERQEYAHLLLNTVGDSRGFSTCLSATGESMRYRLKNVLKPENHAGKHNILALAIACVMIILLATAFDFSFIHGQANDLIFHGQNPVADIKQIIYTVNEPDELYGHELSIETDLWEDYFNQLDVYKATDLDELTSEEINLMVFYQDNDDPQSIFSISFYDNFIIVCDNDFETTSYYIKNKDFKNIIAQSSIIDDDAW